MIFWTARCIEHNWNDETLYSSRDAAILSARNHRQSEGGVHDIVIERVYVEEQAIALLSTEVFTEE